MNGALLLLWLRRVGLVLGFRRGCARTGALWAGLDRVVFGPTIADASRHCRQIREPAKKVALRSDTTRGGWAGAAEGMLCRVYTPEDAGCVCELEPEADFEAGRTMMTEDDLRVELLEVTVNA